MGNLDNSAFLASQEKEQASLDTFYQTTQSLEELHENSCFKDLFAILTDEQDQPKIEIESPQKFTQERKELPTPMALFSTSYTTHQDVHTSLNVKGLEKSASVDTLILEKLSVLVQVHIKDGLEETIFLFSEHTPLLEGVEISIKNYSQAQGVLNIEIKTCDKLQALLHKHKEGLFEALQKTCPQVTIHRLEFSLKTSHQRNDKIAGTNMKKVTKSEMGSHDNQA